ncbi:MAG: helix-turn-helix domain-containing protein [Acutalibacteraceae bacterium]
MLDYKKIGKRIRKYRKAAGLSQEDLAEKVWISVTHMSHIETGSTKLSLPVLVDIAAALNVDTDSLLFDENHIDNDKAILKLINVISNCSTNEILLITEIARSIKSFVDKTAQ